MPQPDPPRPIPPRATGDVENFILAWIGPSEESDIIVLRHVINFVRFFYDPDALNTFLTECTHSKVIIILSYDKARSILNQMYKLTCVYSIYILSTNECEQTDWTQEYHRVTGVYQTVRSLRDHLLQTLPQVSSGLIPVIITSESTTNDIPFTYCQLLKESMLCNDDDSDLKKDMLEFCRFHYESNPIEMNNIDKFEEEFTPQKVIWWYTRNFFITKVLNRAVRTQEIDLLYKMRYIMQCLHTQLKSIAMNERTTVYIVLDIPLDNAMKLQENINGLLLFGAYLPAMLEQPQSINLNEDNEQISITFSINLGPGCGARVKNLCSSDVNIDVLININAVFRIHSVEKRNDRHWNVNLESVSHTDYQFKQLMEPLRGEIEAPVVLLQIGKLLLATDHYAECDYLAELLFADESLRGDPTLLASLAAVHHLLGNSDDEKGHFKAACLQFLKSLRAFQSFLPSDHPLMSASYNNIGSMFFKDNEYNEAITFHQKALDCQLKSASPDTDAIATYSNNIGAVYYEQGKYLEALKHLQRAATILERLSPSEKSLHLCLIYQKIAAIYWRMNKADEALEYYKKTLDIQLVSLPPTAHQISVTYFNLSTAYARVGQIDDAVMTAEKSIEQLLKIFPSDHPEVKENQAQLEIVRQKQWLQQVLTT
jgi:tetratricopeptide (TPR) repeat protein